MLEHCFCLLVKYSLFTYFNNCLLLKTFFLMHFICFPRVTTNSLLFTADNSLLHLLSTADSKLLQLPNADNTFICYLLLIYHTNSNRQLLLIALLHQLSSSDNPPLHLLSTADSTLMLTTHYFIFYLPIIDTTSPVIYY